MREFYVVYSSRLGEVDITTRLDVALASYTAFDKEKEPGEFIILHKTTRQSCFNSF